MTCSDDDDRHRRLPVVACQRFVSPVVTILRPPKQKTSPKQSATFANVFEKISYHGMAQVLGRIIRYIEQFAILCEHHQKAGECL